MFTGTSIAHISTFIALPFISRLIGPDGFGIWALFFSVYAIFVVFINLRYELAILTSKVLSDSKSLLILCFIISFFVSLLLLLTILIFRLDKINNLFLYLPMCIFLWGLNISMINFLSKLQEFKVVASSKVLYSISIAFFQLILVWAYKDPAMMVLGLILGTLISIEFLRRKIHISSPGFSRKLSKEKLRKVANDYIGYPKINMPTAFMDALAVNIPLMYISVIYGSENLGSYALVANILFGLVALASRSISQVFVSEISSQKLNPIEIYSLYKNLLSALFLISFCILTLLVFFGTDIFPFIFGTEWTKAGEISKILAFIFLVRFCVSPLSSSLLALNKIKLIAYWQSFYLSSILFFIVISYIYKINFIEFLLVYACVEIFAYSIYGYLTWSKIKYNDIGIN